MDLDGDEFDDLMTGCFEGGLYLMRGQGTTEFANPEPIRDAAGNILRIGQYWDDEKNEWAAAEGSSYPDYLCICGHAVDFDNDGDFDLVLGGNEGYFFWRENTGSATSPQFSVETHQIMIKSEDDDAAEPLTTGDGHAMPFIHDVDGDGNFDIVSGNSRGSVVWARNVGSKGQPEFAGMRTLIEAGRKAANGEDSVGERSQVCVCDYNRDGKIDVLVGDFSSRTVPRELTEEQQQRFEELEKQMADSSAKYLDLVMKISALSEGGDSVGPGDDSGSAGDEEGDGDSASEGEAGEADEQDKPSELDRLNAELEAFNESRLKLYEEYQELAPDYEMHGFVWLFLGK